MLLYIPFVLFVLAFIKVYKKNGLDLGAFILLAYSATSLASIFLARADTQYDASQLSVVPVLLHCFFTLALAYPFVRFNSNKERPFSPIKNVQLFRRISITFIVLFFVELIATLPILISRFTASSDELDNIRALAYQGEISVDYTMGFIPHFVENIMNILSTGAMCMLVFFFYSLSFLKQTKTYNILLILSSMSPFIYSIITVDRSKFFFWLLLFFFSYFLFKPYLPKGQKKFLVTILLPLLIGFIVYFVIVTVARFGESDMGSEGSVLNYAGQPLFNLSSLWDVLPGTSINFKGIFPLTYYIFDTLFGVQLRFGVNVYNTMSLSELNGFNALVGYGVREVGQSMTIFLLLFLFVVLSSWVGHISRSSTLSLHRIMAVFLMGSIVICGFITYYYSSWPHAFMFWLFVYLTKRLNIGK